MGLAEQGFQLNSSHPAQRKGCSSCEAWAANTLGLSKQLTLVPEGGVGWATDGSHLSSGETRQEEWPSKSTVLCLALPVLTPAAATLLGFM